MHYEHDCKSERGAGGIHYTSSPASLKYRVTKTPDLCSNEKTKQNKTTTTTTTKRNRLTSRALLLIEVLLPAAKPLNTLINQWCKL